MRQALACVHGQWAVPPRLRLGEIRHVRLDSTGRDGIDAYAAYAKQRGEMLHQGVDGALSCCIRRGRTDNGMRSERREENDAASFGHDRKELLHKEERRRSEEHTSELQSHLNLVCRLLLEKKKS